MSNDLLPVGLNRTIADELRAISENIDNHQKVLHKEGTWLFVVVLGCWSVFPAWLRLCALVATMFLFFYRYETNKNDRRPFTKQFAIAKQRISAIAISEKSKRDGIEQLATIKRLRLEGLRPIYELPGFIIGWTAFGATYLATYSTIIKHGA